MFDASMTAMSNRCCCTPSFNSPLIRCTEVRYVLHSYDCQDGPALLERVLLQEP